MCHQKNCADGDHNAQSAPHRQPEDSDWEEEDLDGDIQKAKRDEKQEKEDKLRRKVAAEQCTDNCYHPSPQYDCPEKKTPLTFKIDHHTIKNQRRKKRKTRTLKQ